MVGRGCHWGARSTEVAPMHVEVRTQLAANEARQRAVAEVAARQRHRIAQGVAAREIEIMEAAARQIEVVRGRARRERRAATNKEQEETEHLKRRHASLTVLGSMATPPPHLNNLPTSVLANILLGTAASIATCCTGSRSAPAYAPSGG
jgi:hypothetical protein